MGIRQDVYNENDNYSSAIVTAKYYVEPDENSLWNHREIEYNNAGVPILRLYQGEVKKVYKKVFINGVEQNIHLVHDDNTFEYYVDNGDFSLLTIHGYVEESGVMKFLGNDLGSSIIPNTFTGNVSEEYKHVNNPELLIIVEKEPTIVNLKWGHKNPLILNSLNQVNLSLKIVYDNGQEYEINKNILQHLNIISSNSHAVKVFEMRMNNGMWGPDEYVGYVLHPHNLDERCQIKITDDSLKETFGENIKNIEPLTIITTKEIAPEILLNAKFEVEYEKEIPLIDINMTYNISIYGVYELSDGRILRYNIDDEYEFTSNDESIIHTNVANNTIYPKGLGTTQVHAINNFVDEEFSVIPESIVWDIRIIKTLTNIDWTIDNSELFIGKTEGTINVIAYYTDGTNEDISNSCSFKYDSNVIDVNGNKIIPLKPGTTEISILSSFETGNINNDKVYLITVVQPMEDIDIIDIEKVVLDETELTLHVGDEKDLTYTIYPENATPQTMVWYSTDENVVSVDNYGHIKVLSEGYSRIYVGVKSKEVEIFEDEDRTEEDIPSLYSSVYAVCSINAYAIKVTEIKLSRDEVTLYVGDEDYYFEATVLPENASNKELRLSFESDVRGWPVTIGQSDLFLSPIKEGSGTLKITSVDNPEVFVEMKVIVIDNRVKKVTINPGNDSDYEFYDDLVKSPEVELYSDIPDSKTFSEKTYKISKIKTHERWDDDDFPRYYCPINNSLQLSATVQPNGARFADLIWYSSDGELIKCTETGIITPIRQGKQKLDMYAEDNLNDEGRRFPNTTWITAFNRKSMKSGICQVRVTQNNITGISIGDPIEHDYDVDIFDEDGDIKYDLPKPIEYERDYILWKGEKRILPVNLSVQDPNFGPSNNFEWRGSTEIGNVNWGEIVQLNNEYVNHTNKNDDFDWTSNIPAKINSNKKNLNVEMEAVGLGSIYFYARCTDKYWASAEADNGITNEDGEAIVGDYKVIVSYYGKSQGMYIAKLLPNVSVILNTANQFSITTPAIYHKDDDGNEVEFFVKKNYSDLCNRVEVQIFKNNTPVEDATVFINSYRKANILNEVVDKTNKDGYAINPSPNADEYGNTQVSTYVGDLARPGEGEWKSVDDSRKIKVTVVDAPKNIYLCFESMSRVITKGLPHEGLAPVWPPNTRVKIKYSSKRCVPLFIRFDDEFIETLNEYADGDNCPLDDKYMSFAWFTSDPNVFIPIESSQAEDDRDKPTIVEEFGNSINGSRREIKYNLKGYGRSMCIQPTGTGKAKLTIVNIMSGQTWERLIEVE